MTCRICRSEAAFVFSGQLLDVHLVKYYQCGKCGFLFTEEPTWLGSPECKSVSRLDTGILSRNLLLSKFATVLIKLLLDENGKFLDYGGGYGLFTRLMRDNGLDFYWHDPYCENLFAQGFELSPGTEDTFEAVTAIEVFEHLPHPRELTDLLFKRSRIRTLFFTTLLYGATPPGHNQWWYYSRETGQHVSFYNENTLKYLAGAYGLNLHSNRDNFHLLTGKRINDLRFRLVCRHFEKIYPRLKSRPKTEEDQRTLIARASQRTSRNLSGDSSG